MNEGEREGITSCSGDAVMRSEPPEVNGELSMTPAQPTEVLAVKKKRGRPRKYKTGETRPPYTAVISPKPISSAVPLPSVIDFSAAKRVKSESRDTVVNSNFGGLVACSVGGNFMPHIITVYTGEDITKKIINFSQQGPQAICILSANGAISSVTLRHPASSGGTLSCEGWFEILSLSGSFMPSETSGTRSRTGGMSVSLASPDGRLIGGGVAGSLVAANSVQVVIGSFLASSHNNQTPKKPGYIAFATPTSAVPITTAINMEEAYSKQGPPTKQPSPNTTSPFRGDNGSSPSSDTRSKLPASDVDVSAP